MHGVCGAGVPAQLARTFERFDALLAQQDLRQLAVQLHAALDRDGDGAVSRSDFLGSFNTAMMAVVDPLLPLRRPHATEVPMPARRRVQSERQSMRGVQHPRPRPALPSALLNPTLDLPQAEPIERPRRAPRLPKEKLVVALPLLDDGPLGAPAAAKARAQ